VNNNQNCLINDLKPKIRWYFHFPKKPENFTYFTILCTNIQSASVLLIVALSLVVLVNPFSARSAGKNSLEEKNCIFSQFNQLKEQLIVDKRTLKRNSSVTPKKKSIRNEKTVWQSSFQKRS
jgi:hypothetical protein